jgi:hypothetical protein
MRKSKPYKPATSLRVVQRDRIAEAELSVETFHDPCNQVEYTKAFEDLILYDFYCFPMKSYSNQYYQRPRRN